MSDLLTRLAETLEPLQLRGTRLLVGVSGGADSVALLRGLHLLAPTAQLDLHAAHLNHGLRPGMADEDAEWTRALCHRLGIPITVERADVAARARDERWNIEEAARIVRYEFFERTARAVGSKLVAVAHTADDRVETMLHHLLRGTGLAGLRGMKSVRPLTEGIALVRPLLGVRRPAIESWLAEIGQDYRTDATNADQSRTRSRIRHTLLPSVEQEFGPQVRQTLLQFAAQADELQTALEGQAERLLALCLADESSEICRLDCRVLGDQPRHLVREVFVSVWRRKNWPRQRMSFDDWDRLYGLVQEGGKISLAGKIEAARRGTMIVLRRQ